MPNTSAPEAASRRRVISVFLTQGVAGLFLVVAMTVLRLHETALIVDRLGAAAPLLLVIFFAFALTLSLVKYELTSLIYVSLGITAYMAMSPLLGMVLTAWMAVVVAIGSRLLAMAKIGPGTISMGGPTPQLGQGLRLFRPYRIPGLGGVGPFET